MLSLHRNWMGEYPIKVLTAPNSYPKNNYYSYTSSAVAIIQEVTSDCQVLFWCFIYIIDNSIYYMNSIVNILRYCNFLSSLILPRNSISLKMHDNLHELVVDLCQRFPNRKSLLRPLNSDNKERLKRLKLIVYDFIFSSLNGPHRYVYCTSAFPPRSFLSFFRQNFASLRQNLNLMSWTSRQSNKA